MTVRLAQIWRYPIKGIGHEPLETATLTANAPMPNDRAWALRHEGAPKRSGWQPRRDFLVVANAPKLAQVSARTRSDGSIALTHPDRPTQRFALPGDAARLIDWVRPLWPDGAPAPADLVAAPARGMGDNGAAEVSILNLASLRALSGILGKTLEIERFRGNLVLDGLGPWDEFGLVGTSLRIGDVQLTVTARIERCRATEASPASGTRDTQPLRALHTEYGHRDFGVYARVTTGGTIEIGNEVQTP